MTITTNKSKRIFVAGHQGMIGSAIVRFLRKSGYKDIIVATRQTLDLTNHVEVDRFFRKTKSMTDPRTSLLGEVVKPKLVIGGKLNGALVSPMVC